MLVSDVISAAFTELGVKPPDQDLPEGAGDWGFKKLNRIIDRWNIRRLFIYVINQYTNDLTPSSTDVNGNPCFTVGPVGANFTFPRPLRIESAQIVLTSSSPDVNIPLEVINTDDYSALRVPALTASIPTKLYYSPTWITPVSPQSATGIGTFYPWPFPTVTTNKLSWWSWNQMPAYSDLTDTFSVPPGYEDALTYTLAEEMLPTYPNKAAAEYIIQFAKQARAAVQSLNSVMPKLITRDSGMPTTGKVRPDFNYLTGLTTGSGSK